jgi:Uma2 family endonuclease
MGAVASQLTLEQFQHLPDRPGRQELNAGALVEMPPPFYLHARVLHAFLFRLYEGAKADGRFLVHAETAYILAQDPPTVRVPDISLVAAERLQAVDRNSYIVGAPELAIEVVSPSETATDLNEKIRQYLQAGAWVVLAAYPKTGEVHVHRNGEPTRVLRGEDRLELPAPLPPLGVAVRDFFA